MTLVTDVLAQCCVACGANSFHAAVSITLASSGSCEVRAQALPALVGGVASPSSLSLETGR
jgi:hypothetical protein